MFLWVGAEGVRLQLPQARATWQEDYLELKATETPWAQEKLCPSLNLIEESELGGLSRIRVLSRDTLYLYGEATV